MRKIRQGRWEMSANREFAIAQRVDKGAFADKVIIK